jgi:RHS repeat-associated protein
VGNRVTLNAVEYTYDDADQMLTAGEVDYGYDANGNQTGRGADTFAYDHENRLTQAAMAGNTSTYAYNGDGLRASQTIGGNAVSYTWGVNAGLPVILQDSLDNTYVYGLDLISATDGVGDQTYFLYDGLGSTTELTAGDGSVAGTYAYDVFGPVRTHTGAATQWTYTGEQNDPTGLEYLRARYYDPAIGRFPSRDPVRGFVLAPQTLNPYPYTVNNPVNYTDPSGKIAIAQPLRGEKPPSHQLPVAPPGCWLEERPGSSGAGFPYGCPVTILYPRTYVQMSLADLFEPVVDLLDWLASRSPECYGNAGATGALGLGGLLAYRTGQVWITRPVQTLFWLQAGRTANACMDAAN